MQINNNNHSQVYKVKAKSELLAFKKLLTYYKKELPIAFDDLWDDDEEDYFDTYGEEFEMYEEEITSFLNEYYLIYPDRLPDTQLY
jgi:nuclear transport factor 2 (NTF2) superfamily protein